MSISSSCAVPTPPTNVLAVLGCNYAEVTWGASTFMLETIRNYSVMYQWMNGGDPMTGYTSSTNIALQNLQPNAMYTVSVAGINSYGGTSEFTKKHVSMLQGNFKFMDCHVAVYYCPYTHTNCIASFLNASVLQILWFKKPTYITSDSEEADLMQMQLTQMERRQ